MSTTWKVVVGLVVVVAIALLGWKFMKNPNGDSYTSPTGANTQGTTNSDSSLDSSMTSIDAQMNVVNSNSAQVDQSFQDKPVPQSE